MKIKYAAVKEEQNDKTKKRFWCDKGNHWYLGIGITPEPAVKVEKGGLNFRDCGNCKELKVDTVHLVKLKDLLHTYCEQPLTDLESIEYSQIRKTVNCKTCLKKAPKAKPEPPKEDFFKDKPKPLFSKDGSKKKQTKTKQTNESKLIRTLLTKNPYRKGCNGEKKFAIILKAGKKGILLADYLKAGGQRSDIGWGVDHKFLEVVNG